MKLLIRPYKELRDIKGKQTPKKGIRIGRGKEKEEI